MAPNRSTREVDARQDFKDFLRQKKQMGQNTYLKQLALMEELWVENADMTQVFTQQEPLVARIYNQLTEKDPKIYAKGDDRLYALVRLILQSIHIPRRAKAEKARISGAVIRVQRKRLEPSSRMPSSSIVSAQPESEDTAPSRRPQPSREPSDGERKMIKTWQNASSSGDDALWGFLQACQPSMIEYFMKMKKIGCADIEMLHGMASWDEEFLRDQLRDQLSGDGLSPPAPMHISSLIHQFRRLKERTVFPSCT